MRQLCLERVTKKTHGEAESQKTYPFALWAVVMKNSADYTLGYMSAPPPPRESSKKAWRRWARKTRASLPKRELSGRIVEGLELWPPYKEATHVLTYAAFGSEFDLTALQNKRFYLTRTGETPQRGLTLHEAEGGLERHPFGYSQPFADAELVPPERIDLVLVPGLCFDERGTRLGYGLGYYDRLLPLLRSDALTVGVTADALVVPELPKAPHDIPVTHLVTESGVRRVG